MTAMVFWILTQAIALPPAPLCVPRPVEMLQPAWRRQLAERRKRWRDT